MGSTFIHKWRLNQSPRDVARQLREIIETEMRTTSIGYALRAHESVGEKMVDVLENALQHIGNPQLAEITFDTRDKEPVFILNNTPDPITVNLSTAEVINAEEATARHSEIDLMDELAKIADKHETMREVLDAAGELLDPTKQADGEPIEP